MRSASSALQLQFNFTSGRLRFGDDNLPVYFFFEFVHVTDDAYETVGEVAEGWPCFENRKGYYRVDELQEALDRVFMEWLEKTGQTPKFYHILPLADLVEVQEVTENE